MIKLPICTAILTFAVHTAVFSQVASTETRAENTLAEIRTLAWSPDGKLIALARQDGSAQIVDAATQQTLLAWQADSPGPTLDLAWSPDGTKIATGGNDELAKVWDASTGELISTQEHGEIVTAVDWSPDGSKLASFDYGGRIIIWDPVSGRLLLHLRSSSVLDGAWSPDGTRVADAAGVAVELWDAHTGDFLGRTAGNIGEVGSLDWSPDSTRIVGSSKNSGLAVWDASTYEIKTSWFVESKNTVLSVARNSDGTLIASAGGDGNVIVWDVPTGQIVLVIQADGPVSDVAWSPDGTQLAYGGSTGVLHIIPAPVTLPRTGTRGFRQGSPS